MSIPQRLIVVAGGYNEARAYASANALPPGAWVYVLSRAQLLGNRGAQYVKVGTWYRHPEIEAIEAGIAANQLQQLEAAE